MAITTTAGAIAATRAVLKMRDFTVLSSRQAEQLVRGIALYPSHRGVSASVAIPQ